MSILIDQNTRLIVQGITGRDGAFHARLMKEYGTQVVGGVTPGKGGQEIEGIPVFNSVAEAVRATDANASIIFVPANFAGDALLEAAFSGVELIVCVTEGVPVLDAIKAIAVARNRGVRIVGPNCPGAISPGKAKVGIMPATAFRPGPVGIVSRSGTLTYEIAANTGEFGQSTVVGIGGDPVIGTNFIDCLKMFQDDPETKAIVIVGEIGGSDEEKAAQFVKQYVTKPVFGFIAGQTAPPDKRMGHAGAIISAGSGTAQEKIRAFQSAGIDVIYEPEELAEKLNARIM
ncbi:MAG: succinate--CoA ligase subunit alpha [candidate division WOR-3 bacterium]|jgi:succinyl-CoA synthetase alpha subunit|nr:succinate--CoA ligase subunit alpha [candidate division WOR-3 bacterium]MCR4423427.1 succinate--CoA ligase subunit alpha [candidate division WOR-3 bacterium]MDH7518766.1 succinate--CoA ligase subunit alpha [bacterium]